MPKSYVDPAPVRPKSVLAPFGIRAVVVDSGALMNDVLRRTRQSWPTGLLEAASGLTTRVFATERVRTEVEHHLPRLAEQRGVPIELAMDAWRQHYLRAIHFVGLPVGYFPREAQAVADRDQTDVPTAALACLIQADAVLSEDRDLLDTGFATFPWLNAAIAIRDLARFQAGVGSAGFALNLVVLAGGAAGREAVRRPTVAALVVAGVAAVLALPGVRSRLPSRRQLTEILEPIVESMGRTVEAANRAEAEIQRRVVLHRRPHDLERLAFVLARARSPMTRAEVAAHAGLGPQVVDALTASPPFLIRNRRYSIGAR